MTNEEKGAAKDLSDSESATLEPGDFVYLAVSWVDPPDRGSPFSDSIGLLLGSGRYPTIEQHLIGSHLGTQQEYLITNADGITEIAPAPPLETVFDTETARLLDQLGLSTVGTFLTADLSGIGSLPIDQDRLTEMRRELADSLDGDIVTITNEEIYRWENRSDSIGTEARSEDRVSTAADPIADRNGQLATNPNSWPQTWPTSGGNFRRSGSRDTHSVPTITGTERWSNSDLISRVGNAAPAVIDGRVFVWTNRGMAAFDASSGDVEWHKKYPAITRTDGGWPFDLQSPIGTDGSVYFAPQLTALDVASGDHEQEFAPRTAVARVSIADNRLLITGGGSLLRTERLSGRERGAEVKIEGFDEETPQHAPAYSTEHGIAVVGNNEGALCGIDIGAGSVDWRVGHHGSFRTPAVATHVYAATSDHRLVAIDVDTGDTVWRADITNGPISDPAVAGDRVYVTATDGLYAVDVSTGETDLEYSFDSAGADRGASPVPPRPTIVRNRNSQVVFTAVADTLYAVHGSTERSTSTQCAFDATVTTQPVHANGTVFVRTADGVLHAVE
ncbi:PQQ-binding-like beta-propeller repeat protein [Halobaculum sp. WSA2]|uniref:PQQ-binding-like beta-propeller repeat protein n=1 Tax=Halobaculum saliterrae TaxID=2073113 RepID=A0A6B0SVQ1_9EURY|nr:PQQ-binding-like beta-propeller repeat protein [Halobaculum saliterrae]MXR40741.1 PQQ-binding-like beta-propeller repeat protein [Halobaculum saliterrae]